LAVARCNGRPASLSTKKNCWIIKSADAGRQPASDFNHPISRRPDHPIPLAYNRGMANLTLVYGLRLLPSDEVAEVGAGTIKLKSGREAHVTMHTLEGSKDEIERQLRTSLAAFFDIYPEI
jgi:hypothetical protein